jgi:ribosomal protein S18 acetylase RimI-like enzyme
MTPGKRRDATFDDVAIDPPQVAAGQVVASGTTASGLRVELEGFDTDRTVETPSEFEEWPDDLFVVPPKHGRLLVVVTDAERASAVVGAMSWHVETYGPTQGSMAWNIGIGLTPECRGHGVGTVAQRLLAEWLLATTPLHRVEASTDVSNVGEQKALERAGFRREGVIRAAQTRTDGVHDLVGYSLLRSDL